MGNTGMFIFHSRVWGELLKTEVVCWPIMKLFHWPWNYITARAGQKSGLPLEKCCAVQTPLKQMGAISTISSLAGINQYCPCIIKFSGSR